MVAKRTATLGVTLCLALLSGCASKPQPHDGEADFRLAAAYENVQQTSELNLVDSLTEVFSDTQLTDAIELALNQNYSLSQAYAQLVAAGFAVDISSSALYPTLDLNSTASRRRQVESTYSTAYQLSLDSSWEVDVWGKLADAVDASEAEFRETELVTEDARQSIAAQVAQAYFAVINAKHILQIYQNEYESYKSTEKTIEERFVLGLSEAGDLANAKTASYNAQQNSLDAANALREAERQFNALLGNYPSSNALIGSEYPGLEKTIAVGLPSDLLQARPDVQAAYMAVVAADKDALVSYKDMFPSFTITASDGRSSDTLANLTDGTYSLWSLVGGIAQPLFDAGLRKARLQQNSALADAAYFQYQQTLLDAFAEVEQALDNETTYQQRLEVAKKTLEAADIVAVRTKENYINGLDDIFNLLEAERNKFSALRIVENLEYQRYINRVALALALGKAV